MRKVTKFDIPALVTLHKKVATTPNGIARNPEEINEKTVGDFVEKSLEKGLCFVIENPANPQELISEIHCFKHEPSAFKHTLGNLTLVVHPDFQGRGFGRKIFSHLLNEIKNNHPSIRRVELSVRDNNHGAMKLYKALGFEVEGVMRDRILDAEGKLGGDVMMALLLELPK